MYLRSFSWKMYVSNELSKLHKGLFAFAVKGKQNKLTNVPVKKLFLHFFSYKIEKYNCISSEFKSQSFIELRQTYIPC